jgi:NAD-dependent deacetylase
MSDLEKATEALVEALGSGPRIVVLTGAGVSAESGVPTFRGAGGLWKGFDPQELATSQAFKRDPEMVWEWYDWRRGLLAACAPNPGHQALAELEELLPEFLLMTQNVDRLHQKAGSRRVLELHGNIWTLRCFRGCGYQRLEERTPLPGPLSCPDCGAFLRPGVVWFGESLPQAVLQEATVSSQACQVFLVVGTSSQVYPAAGLAGLAASSGARVFEINPDPASRVPGVTILQGPSGEILPQVVVGLRKHR